MAFSLIARSAVRVDGISVEPLAWDAARYQALRLAAKAIAYARIDSEAKRIGLAGAFAYTLDDDTMTYGLRSVQGKVKASSVTASD